MAQDIYDAIIAPHLEVTVVRCHPTLNHYIHFYLPLTERESPGRFFSAIPGVAFNTDVRTQDSVAHWMLGDPTGNMLRNARKLSPPTMSA